MKATRLTLTALATLALGGTIYSSTSSPREVERTDFGITRTAVTPAYDARVAPASGAAIKEFRIPMTHDTIEIAKGPRPAGGRSAFRTTSELRLRVG